MPEISVQTAIITVHGRLNRAMDTVAMATTVHTGRSTENSTAAATPPPIADAAIKDIRSGRVATVPPI